MELTGNILKGESKKDEIRLHAQKEVKKHKEHIGQIIVHKGQKLWELNLITKEISEAKVEHKVVTYLDGRTQISRSSIIKLECLYAVAINKRTAARKFLKQLKSK